MASTESATQAVIRQLVIRAIARVLHSAGIPVPEPVIAGVVDLFLSTVGDVEPHAIATWVMERLGYPEYAPELEKVLRRRPQSSSSKRGVERCAPAPACEIDCPESGDTISLDKGPGEYTCPDCEASILLRGGIARHAHDFTCLITGDQMWVGPEDGTYVCEGCGLEIDVRDGEATHDVEIDVVCPESGDTIALGSDGEYNCPDCDRDIIVVDGVATHDHLLKCPITRTWFWVGCEEGTWECPECGAEVDVAAGDAEHEGPPRREPARRRALK